MGRPHPSTPAQRAQWVSQMIAHAGEYGSVTALSRTAGASRQTLYTWEALGRRALEVAFAPAAPPPVGSPRLERAVLTLLIEGHASYRGLRACLRAVTGQDVSLGAIAAIIAEAQRRALAWLRTHAPAGARPIALDELYGNDRHGGYLSVVDTASLAVWAVEGPLPVDSESWTLVLWLAHDRGLRWTSTVQDGGAAMQAACATVDPDGQHGRDVWHVLHRWAQLQGRLERRVAEERARLATATRQADRIAAGKRPRGGKPQADVAAQAERSARAERTAADLRALGRELQRLLEVVVLDRRGLLDGAARRRDLDALLALLAEVRAAALPAQQAEVGRLHTSLTQALPGLLAFTGPLEAVQQAALAEIGADGVALVGWAWQRRAILGPARAQLMAGLAPAWRPAAGRLIQAWEAAVRASSAVETWHSVLRPHLAVHRTLSPGLLALLAVWHNHRVFTAGVRHGRSPLQLSGLADAPTDWLVALGYPPPDAPATAPAPLPIRQPPLAAAA
jgi:hypothetical protein